MDRRRFLAATAAGLTATAAGCVEAFESAAETTYGREPPLVDPRPERIYWPTHTEQMQMAGMATTSDGRRVSLMYTFPHRFWRVFRGDDGGYESRIFEVNADDAVHLMANVWDADTGVVLPVSSVDIAVTGGDDVDERETIYPMLSQRMGFHYGDNYHLDGDGGYTAAVTVGSVTADRFGDFENRLDAPETVEIDFEYSEAGRNDLDFTEYDQAGDEGAVEPMAMDGMPTGTARELGGTAMGEGTDDDIRYRASLLSADRFGTDPYLAVTAATRYNEFVVPDMGLDVTVDDASGETVLADSLSPGLDPELGFHYGVSAPGVTGEESVTIEVTTPPQVARHEGYETAFFKTPTHTLS
ncbi:MAG: Tat pathway signal protein [Euryarchaeota archaeon]|nr:Tat pathway signal protein [Euryarchaeota archaeon]